MSADSDNGAIGAVGYVAVGAAAMVVVALVVSPFLGGRSFAGDHGLDATVAWLGEDQRGYVECLIADITARPHVWNVGDEFELVPPNDSLSVTDWFFVRGPSGTVRIRYATGNAVEIAGFSISARFLQC